MKHFKIYSRRSIRVAISLLTGLTMSGASLVAGSQVEYPNSWTSTPHVFTMDNVQATFDGENASDIGALCVTNAPGVCSGDLEGPPDARGGWYAIDSEFGFYVTDFVGAEGKVVDGDYTEGYVTEVVEHGDAGIAVSNAKTDTFKVPYPRGTWCAGLGGVSVKCSTENYSVLEHILTCHETLPYLYAGANDIPLEPGDPAVVGPWTNTEELAPGVTCAQLDNELFEIVNNELDLTKPVGPDEIGFPYMPANESTVLNDVAVSVSKDYAVTRKDDGKALYRFGNLVKRPNDVRVIAHIPLPESFYTSSATIAVTRAELTINHLVTNNPNDQVRPEDMENEDAIGRKPGVQDKLADVWLSDRECYEGDGDLIPLGTVLKQSPVIDMNPEADIVLASLYVTSSTVNDVSGAPYPFPFAFSGDLRDGTTNAWATSIDRDPFEWSDGTLAGMSPNAGRTGDDLLTPTSVDTTGPRWRLLPNKFGQDIPGLEIPSVDCIPVPFTSAFIKYEVGEPATTVINLLDWEDVNENGLQDDSPLATHWGWVNASANWQNYTEATGGEEGTCIDEGEFCNDAANGISVNGAVLTEDFDVVVYVKGDRKPTELYNMSLYLEYVTMEEEPPIGEDVLDSKPQLITMRPIEPSVGSTTKAIVRVINTADSEVNATGTVSLVGAYDAGGIAFQQEWPFTDLAPGDVISFRGQWTPDQAGAMTWTATTNVTGETVTDNDTLIMPFTVVP